MRSLALGVLFASWLGGLIYADEPPSWQTKMKALAGTMGELLPELVSPQGDRAIIEKGAKALAELSHDLQEGREKGKLVPPADVDPSVRYLVTQFSEQAKRAYSVIQLGNLEYGKSLLRTVTTYCIACHTRHENGPEFSTFPLSPKAEKLGKAERAELYVATRQFDKGLALFQELIADKDLAKNHPFDWEQPIRNALAIAVRVKKDPASSAEIIATASKLPLPDFEQARLAKWKKAVDAWKKEPAIKIHTEAGLAAEMRRLLKEAMAVQWYPVDRSAEIQYLRASAAAHDLLRVATNPRVIAEALMGAGAAYEVLSNPAFWPMHEFYYEACIRQLPHSDLSRECFSRFEQSVYFGYTGTSGTRVPGDTQELLLKLKALAGPAKGGGKGSAHDPK